MSCSTAGSGTNFTYQVNGAWSITQALATPTYTSFGWYSTKSPTDKSYSVLLSATVVATSGDIRTATVKFMEGSTLLCTAPVGLVNPSDTKVGVVSCYWNGSLSSLSDAEEHDITVVVSGNYTGTSDPTPITISPASIANFITGGGYLALTNFRYDAWRAEQQAELRLHRQVQQGRHQSSGQGDRDLAGGRRQKIPDQEHGHRQPVGNPRSI